MEKLFHYNKCFYDDLKLLKFTPSFYYYLALIYDVDILRYIPHPSKEYDFKTIVNNANESIFHVAIAFSIYILFILFLIERFDFLFWLLNPYSVNEQKNIFVLKDENGLTPLDLLFCNTCQVNYIEYYFTDKNVKFSEEEKQEIKFFSMKVEQRSISKYIKLICSEDNESNITSLDSFETILSHFKSRVKNVFYYFIYIIIIINRTRIGI